MLSFVFRFESRANIKLILYVISFAHTQVLSISLVRQSCHTECVSNVMSGVYLCFPFNYSNQTQVEHKCNQV